jgi:hypothetical protein
VSVDIYKIAPCEEEKRRPTLLNAKHSSVSAEHYTPINILEAARTVLGGFDLDPASSIEANQLVRATRIYTEKDNGLALPWEGRLLVNPPGGICDKDGCRVIRASKASGTQSCIETGTCGLSPGHKHEGVTGSARAWWAKLAHEWEAGRVSGAIFIGFSIELLQTAQSGEGCSFLPQDFLLCVPSERIPFDTWVDGVGRVPGNQPTHANVIVCVTDAADVADRFEGAFESIGVVFNK